MKQFACDWDCFSTRRSANVPRNDCKYFCPTTYLGGELERYRLLYSGTQRLKTESVYSLGVAAAAIDTICTEHRASLMDFAEKYRQR